MADTRQQPAVNLEDLPDPPTDHGASAEGAARSADERVERLRAGADDLRNARTGSFLDRTNLLVIVAGALMTLGLTLILVGWSGASGSIHVEEQVPYLISGAILGAALAIIGALCLFTHWLTVGIREARAREERAEQRHAELMTALSGSEWQVVYDYGEGGGDNGRTDRDRRERPLRPTPRGS